MLPEDWRLPDKQEWAGILLSDEAESFRSTAGRLHYFCGVLEFMGKEPWQTLETIPKAERLTLLTVGELALNQAVRRVVLRPGRSASTGGSGDGIDRGSRVRRNPGDRWHGPGARHTKKGPWHVRSA